MINPDLERDGIHLVNVHPDTACAGRACPIHAPTDHHMRSWTLHWRSDRGIFERICPRHGCGHPDPDQGDYWREVGEQWQWVHGCCLCCAPSRRLELDVPEFDYIESGGRPDWVKSAVERASAPWWAFGLYLAAGAAVLAAIVARFL